MKKIAVTGFYATGSSAVVDLLREYKNCSCAIGERYEHYVFLLPNALFDLENRLFSENSNYMTIDYALTMFKKEMERQNDNNFGWLGSYKHLFGNEFMGIVNKFFDNISEENSNSKSFTQLKRIKYSLFKCVLQLGARILKKRKVAKWGRVYVYGKEPRRYLKVSHEEFLQYAREFVNDYFKLCQKENNNMIYDHLLLPEQLNMVPKFFDDEFRFIIVDRDPRDVLISSKYILSTVAFGLQKGPFPKTLESTCRHWETMHKNINVKALPKNVLVVQFEDLVYKYDETVKIIEEFCGLKQEDHIKAKQIFTPEKSISNTQVYKMKDGYKEEVQIIEKKLGDRLYDFPYEIKTDIKKMFDD